MNDKMDIENLNLSISNILDGFQQDLKSKCSLTEQELRDMQDELYEFVPIDDESESGSEGENQKLEQDDSEDQEEEEEDEGEEESGKKRSAEEADDEESKNESCQDSRQQKSKGKQGIYSQSMINHSSDESNQEFSECLGQNEKRQIKVKENSSNSNSHHTESSGDDYIETDNHEQNDCSVKNRSRQLSSQSLCSGKGSSAAIQSEDGSVNNLQVAVCKKKKISKQKKPATNQQQTKVSYVDIYRRKDNNQKCNMKLRIPYSMPQNAQSYFLMGDVVIEMNFASINTQDYQNCILNMYKPVQKVIYNKKTRCLSMYQASSNEFLVDFDFVSKQLINYPDQNIHLVGKLIEKYQEITKLLHLQIRNVSTLSGFTQELIAQRRAYFDEQVNYFLEKVDEHQMYFIQKFHTNYATHSFEAYEVGYSRQFLALLGTDEQTITSIIFRKGKPELYNFESRLKMMLVRMLSIVQGKFKGAQSDFEIYTFDNIRVYAKLKILPVCIEYPAHLKLPLDNYNEINCMAFGLIDVDPNMVQQIITLRKQDKYHSHLKSIVQELCYTKQSEEFLEKYYEKSKSKYQKDRQNLQKRKQITKENEQILINHQQKQIEYSAEGQMPTDPSLDNDNQNKSSMYEEKSLNNSGFLNNDFLGQSFYDDNSQQFRYVSKANSEIGSNESPYKCEIEQDLIKYNHFNHIEESYITQDVHLSRGQEGFVQLVQSYPEPCVSNNQPMNSSFISPATNLKNVFAKSHRIIQYNDHGNHSSLDSIQFEFKIV